MISLTPAKLIGGVSIGVIIALSGALWWTAGKLDRATRDLAVCQKLAESSESRRDEEGETAIEAVTDERQACASEIETANRLCEARIARRAQNVPLYPDNCPERRLLPAGSLREPTGGSDR